MAFPSNYYIDSVLKYMYNIKNGIEGCDKRIIDDAREWLIDNKAAFIKFYNQTSSIKDTIQLILDNEENLVDIADANISKYGNMFGESMTIKEAKKLLEKNNYQVIENLDEGFLSDLKDKVVSKVKNYFSFNDWIRDVKMLLKTKYRISIEELKNFINVDSAFKKCYEMSIKPINFVKGLMQKYGEIMQQKAIDDDPYEYKTITPAVAEAYAIISDMTILSESKKSLKEDSDYKKYIAAVKEILITKYDLTPGWASVLMFQDEMFDDIMVDALPPEKMAKLLCKKYVVNEFNGMYNIKKVKIKK